MRKILLSDIIDSAIISEDTTVVLYDKHFNQIIKCEYPEKLQLLDGVIQVAEVISIDITANPKKLYFALKIVLNMSINRLLVDDIAKLNSLKKLFE